MGMPFRKRVTSQILLGMAAVAGHQHFKRTGIKDVYITFLSLTALFRQVCRSAGRVCSDACHFPTPVTCFIQHLLTHLPT